MKLHSGLVIVPLGFRATIFHQYFVLGAKGSAGVYVAADTLATFNGTLVVPR